MRARVQEWARSDPRSAAGLVMIAVGAVALGLGVAGVMRAGRLQEALSYVASGGIVGLFLVACGITLRSTGQVRREWEDYAGIRAALSTATARPAMTEDASGRWPL